MRTLKIAVIFLSLAAIFGMPAAQAQEASTAALTVTTDEEIYTIGNKIVITAVLEKHSTPPNQLTLIIKDPNGKIVHLAQADPTPKSPETFSVKAIGGKWSESGPYTVKATYGSQSAIAAFKFISDKEPVAPTPPPGDDVMEEEKKAMEEKEKMEAEKKAMEEKEKMEAEKKAMEEKMKMEEMEKMKEKEMTAMTCAAGEVKKGEECVSICGEGTQFIDGQCSAICGPGTEWDGKRCISEERTNEKRGGCLIATAAYGTELAPQLQMLREVRDNTLMQTSSGTSFMSGFNTLYYTFSPTIADWERQSPAFASAVGALLTPMISTLSIMNLAEDTDVSVLAVGISVIALNLGIYIGIPTGAIYGTRKIFKILRA